MGDGIQPSDAGLVVATSAAQGMLWASDRLHALAAESDGAC